MPYHWLPPTDGTQRLHLWPYRSLPRRGMVWFIGGTAALIAVPLVGLLGSPVLWGLLPFLLAAIAGIWWALERNFRDGEILEDLTLSPGRITLTRHGPRGARQEWEANPHWVRPQLHPTGGPVPHYLTLTGGPPRGGTGGLPDRGRTQGPARRITRPPVRPALTKFLQRNLQNPCKDFGRLTRPAAP